MLDREKYGTGLAPAVTPFEYSRSFHQYPAQLMILEQAKRLSGSMTLLCVEA